MGASPIALPEHLHVSDHWEGLDVSTPLATEQSCGKFFEILNPLLYIDADCVEAWGSGYLLMAQDAENILQKDEVKHGQSNPELRSRLIHQAVSKAFYTTERQKRIFKSEDSFDSMLLTFGRMCHQMREQLPARSVNRAIADQLNYAFQQLRVFKQTMKTLHQWEWARDLKPAIQLIFSWLGELRTLTLGSQMDSRCGHWAIKCTQLLYHLATLAEPFCSPHVMQMRVMQQGRALSTVRKDIQSDSSALEKKVAARLKALDDKEKALDKLLSTSPGASPASAAGREARDRRKALCLGCSYKHKKPTYTFCHYGNKGQCPNAQPSSEELDFAAPPNG